MHPGDFLFIEKIAGAVKKNNNGLADAVNKAVVDLMADGTYAALSKQYFGEDIRCH
jgi:polar amino acid transport system substrate-binding protein